MNSRNFAPDAFARAIQSRIPPPMLEFILFQRVTDLQTLRVLPLSRTLMVSSGFHSRSAATRESVRIPPQYSSTTTNVEDKCGCIPSYLATVPGCPLQNSRSVDVHRDSSPSTHREMLFFALLAYAPPPPPAGSSYAIVTNCCCNS